MAVGDIYRMALVMNLDQDEVINVFHCKVETSVGTVAGEAEACALGWESGVMPSYLNQLHLGIIIETLSVRGVTTPTLGFDHPVNEPGLVTGNLLPFQTSPMIVWRTALIGRRFRGKTFLPPTTEELVTNGIIAAGLVGAIDAFIADHIGGWGATTGSGVYTFTPVVWSTVAGVGTAITSGQVMNTVRTQRRRRSGVGS